MRGMNLSGKWIPVLAMVAVEAAFSVLNILLKRVLDEGMNLLVLITYRQSVATAFMAPIAFFRERKSWPKLTVRIFWQHFLSALLGATLTQYLFFLGIQHTSATFACAFINLVPVVTFIISVFLRLEAVNLRSNWGIAKVLGTTECVGGAMVLTLYKGMALTNSSHRESPVGRTDEHTVHAHNAHSWMVGSIALLTSCLCWASWFPLQAKIGKIYPHLYSSTVLLSFLSAVQSAVLSLILKRDVSVWCLKGKEQIILILYAGIVGSALCFLVMSWCVEQRGPVFTAAFSPLIQIIVATVGLWFLHEQLHLGSVLGSILVIMGLYVLLWGKNKESQSRREKTVLAVDEECNLPPP